MRDDENSLRAIVLTALFAAMIYVGVLLRIPLPAIVGRPFIHFGNTLTAVAILLLGFRNGALAGVIGLGGFDLLNGYAATSWLTMLETLVVAIVLSAIFKAMKYNDSTKNIMNRDAFAKMKQGASIVNTSRGAIMDYRALYDALRSGKLRSAAVDVYPQEPPVNEPLLELPNVIATPHIATYTVESNDRMGIAAAKNIVDFFGSQI